jgi:hypothetical protein
MNKRDYEMVGLVNRQAYLILRWLCVTWLLNGFWQHRYSSGKDFCSTAAVT